MKLLPVYFLLVYMCSIRELYDLPGCVCYWIVLIVTYASLQKFKKVLKQKQVELELLRRGEVGTEEHPRGTGEGKQYG